MIETTDENIKTDIKSLTKEQLIDIIESMGEKKFRANQIFEWLYKQHVNSFNEMSNLSKALREQLKTNFALGCSQIKTKLESKDGTRKYLVSFSDNVCVEAVGIPSTDPSSKSLTVCFSTQAGCAIGCIFCATGQNGFARNLNCGEMFDQVYLIEKDFGLRVSNVVAMGQGEPFANYDATLAALRLMNNKDYLGIGARHITLSSCGLLGGIEKFSKESEQFTLAISLHSAIQETRNMLMPGVSSVDLTSLKAALKLYGDTTKRRPSLEYVLIQDVNDADEDLDALIDFCHGMLCHVNLIPLNPAEPNSNKKDAAIKLHPSNKMSHFKQTLQSKGIEVSIRNSRGADIDGACGQLHQRIFNAG